MKKLKCELCEKEYYLLVRIEVAGDSFGSSKGICAECFKNGDIEEGIFLRNKKFVESHLRAAEDRMTFWKEELNNLK